MTNKLDFSWYKLFCTNGFGNRSISIVYSTIHNQGFPLEKIFDMDRSEFERTFPELGRGKLKKANFEALQRLNKETLYEEYKNQKDNGIEIIYPGHQLYPKNLLELSPILFCKGQFLLLKSDGIAIVGSRNASDEGVEVAKKFAAELAMQGKNVISGYAKGIDTSAHLGALEKDGTTTIVLSFGILEFSRKKVFENLKWRGNTLVISQFHPKEKWNAKNGMIRNKLVCALSKAVIIIESGEERNDSGKMSGTFDAGKTALRMGIPLFVVDPVSFKNPPPGNKELIKRGGIKIQQKDGIAILLKHFETRIIGVEPVTTEKQMSLFKKNQNGG